MNRRVLMFGGYEYWNPNRYWNPYFHFVSRCEEVIYDRIMVPEINSSGIVDL